MDRGHKGAAEGPGTPAHFDLLGTISSAGFASGDRFVVGWWEATPIGPMRDVMWARPDGERVLLVDRPAAGRFISTVYRFDRVDVVAVTGEADRRSVRLRAGDVGLDLEAGRGWRLPLPRFRTAGITRWVEGPVARAAMGVRTYGVSPSGVREWYRADEYRPLVSARATVGGVDLGPRARFTAPAGFGFSEPPRRPAMVRVRPRMHDPSGHLDEVLAELR